MTTPTTPALCQRLADAAYSAALAAGGTSEAASAAYTAAYEREYQRQRRLAERRRCQRAAWRQVAGARAVRSGQRAA